MRHAAVAIIVAFGLALAANAEAQVVISGQVTSYTTPSGGTGTTGGSAYVSGEPTPTRYIHRSQNLPALYVPGIIAMVAGYAINVFGLSWYAESQIGGAPWIDYYLYGLIPIAGPWLQFASPGPNSYVMSIVTGILEAGGLILTILGLTITEEWDEPVYVFNEHDPMSPTLSFNVEGAPGGGAIGTATLSHF